MTPLELIRLAGFLTLCVLGGGVLAAYLASNSFKRFERTVLWLVCPPAIVLVALVVVGMCL